ncbi:MAG TPA: adenylate/guanylate cyclase domain-containing protein [Mariprofundaceae bacterium]|nr:adenylate/guanylate cyclase domain-containing protein [Mariprofundaceae bacterium]
MSKTPTMGIQDKPFPLKRYYILYAGIGGIVFYAMLFSFFIHAERQALHQQYIYHLVEKANSFYREINRDILEENHASFESISHENDDFKQMFRAKIESLVKTDFGFAKVKVFNRTGMVLYDYENKANEGLLYNGVQGEGFQAALANKTFSKEEDEPDGRRFIEVYLPAHAANSNEVVGVLEVYEDVSRFESIVIDALQEALVIPTLIFLAFNMMLLVLVFKADAVITSNTMFLISVRQQMEKYLSRSTTEAIYSSVTEQKELFKGEMQDVVIFFSDIRGFTSYSEREKPEVVVENLNKLFELQAGIIHQHHGVIDKFIGDEIMAIFPKDASQGAVQAGLEIQQEIQASQDVNFDVGVGVHYGEALLGSIGTEDRRDYTVIGNIVNTGARFCGAAKGGTVIISEVVYQQLDDKLKQHFKPSEPLKLKGKNEVIVTYVG